jgi:predicted DNA-binding transcriptional regulator AlpA
MERIRKRFLRKKQLAERYQTSTRTIDRWARAGRLPKPIYLNEFPLWDEDQVEACERAAMRGAHEQ